jgi:beta-1,3-galactosyltransferase 1
LIATVPSNYLVRKVNRETWLTPSHNNTGQVRHAFLIGTTNDEILTSQVKQEHVNFGDIIQFSFYESYRNLTLKTLMGFKWATEFCSSAHFIMHGEYYMSSSRKNLRYLPVYSLVFSHRILYIHLLNIMNTIPKCTVGQVLGIFV